MGIEEGEEVQTKGICNIFNKIITENFPNLKKVFPFRCRKPPGHQTDLTKIEPPYCILPLKQAQRTEKELKAVKEKKQITYKGKSIKVTADFSTKTLKARMTWSEVF
jgi:hypothetical protein